MFRKSRSAASSGESKKDRGRYRRGYSRRWVEPGFFGCHGRNTVFEGIRRRTFAISGRFKSNRHEVFSEIGLVKTQLNLWAKKFIATCEVNASPVISQTGQCAGFQIARYAQHHRADIRRLQKIGADETEIAAEIDCIMVRRASELTFQKSQAEDPFTVVDVHYSTLSDKSHRERFLDACRSVKNVGPQYLIVRIIYSSEEPPDRSFYKLVKNLEPFFQSRILDIKKPALRNLNYQACQIPIFSMNSQEFETAMTHCKEPIQRFFQTVHTSRVRFLVDEVSNEDAGKVLFSLGADFVSFRDRKTDRVH